MLQNALMADVVYLLGAGFNLSLVDRFTRQPPPLARNFFRLLLGPGRLRERLDGVRQQIYVDQLLAEIVRYWHLSLDDLETTEFDIEECLTLLQSLQEDAKGTARGLELQRASYSLRALMLMYLSDTPSIATAPSARRFGADVLAQEADVLTFNYDTIAESSIASASGIGSKPMQDSLRGDREATALTDDDLDASQLTWKEALAYGFMFAEVPLPVAGPSLRIPGERFYSHPANQLYKRARVLKLHGSIDWLTFGSAAIRPAFEGEDEQPPPDGIVLERHASFWMGGPPTRGRWAANPLVIPPHLYKNYEQAPFPTVWAEALATLAEAKQLIVVGYSFPPTDFRVRRLFREAFADHALESLVVANPDGSVVDVVRALTHFGGPAVTCADLPSL